MPKHTHCKVCTCKFCRNSAKFALQSLQMQSGQTLHLFVLKSMEKASLIFTGKSCVLTCANCKNCNLRKLCACGTNSLHVLSGACVLHFPKSKLRILSQDCWLIKSLRVLDSTAKVLEVPSALAWRLLRLLEAPPSSPLEAPLKPPFKPPFKPAPAKDEPPSPPDTCLQGPRLKLQSLPLRIEGKSSVFLGITLD